MVSRTAFRPISPVRWLASIVNETNPTISSPSVTTTTGWPESATQMSSRSFAPSSARLRASPAAVLIQIAHAYPLASNQHQRLEQCALARQVADVDTPLSSSGRRARNAHQRRHDREGGLAQPNESPV
jgi:hypothetical protein